MDRPEGDPPTRRDLAQDFTASHNHARRGTGRLVAFHFLCLQRDHGAADFDQPLTPDSGYPLIMGMSTWTRWLRDIDG